MIQNNFSELNVEFHLKMKANPIRNEAASAVDLISFFFDCRRRTNTQPITINLKTIQRQSNRTSFPLAKHTRNQWNVCAMRYALNRFYFRCTYINRWQPYNLGCERSLGYLKHITAITYWRQHCYDLMCYTHSTKSWKSSNQVTHVTKLFSN